MYVYIYIYVCVCVCVCVCVRVLLYTYIYTYTNSYYTKNKMSKVRVKGAAGFKGIYFIHLQGRSTSNLAKFFFTIKNNLLILHRKIFAVFLGSIRSI